MAEHFLYILYSERIPKTYTGVTSDIPKRISEHNSGSNNFTSKFRPWKLLYSEKCVSKSVAFDRERYFKSHAGRKKIAGFIDAIK